MSKQQMSQPPTAILKPIENQHQQFDKVDYLTYHQILDLKESYWSLGFTGRKNKESSQSY